MNKQFITIVGILILFLCFGCGEDPYTPPQNNIVVSDFPESFIAPYNGSSPGQYALYITSSGDRQFEFTFNNKSNWLDIINVQHTDYSTTPDSIFLTFRILVPSPLPYGTYYDTITISSDQADNSPVEREVVLHIGSQITAEPGSMDFIGSLQGDNPPSQALDVNSNTGVDFPVTFSHASNWLQIPVTTYNTNDTDKIPISIDLSGLAKGFYQDTIFISSDSALNSPFPVPITLTVSSWTAQVSPVNHNINDVFFTDANTGYAVGDVTDILTKSGFIIRTTDGGANWEEVLFVSSSIPESDSILGSVSFIGSDGWTVGSNDIILHTSDGGDNWDFQTNPFTDSFYVDPDTNTVPYSIDFTDVFFIDRNTGWIVGDSGKILHTDDAGMNWYQQTSNTLQRLTGISFVDNMHGWVCGLTDVMLVTSDGGATWIKQSIPLGPAGNKYDFQEVSFSDLDHGWTVGKFGLIVSTTDGGTIWNYTELPVNNGLLAVQFVDNQFGWVAGQNGTLFHTEDGGATWMSQFVETGNTLSSLFFINRNIGWVVGGGGDIFFTASSGD